MPPGRGGHLTTELSAVESAGQPTPDVPILSLSAISGELDRLATPQQFEEAPGPALATPGQFPSPSFFIETPYNKCHHTKLEHYHLIRPTHQSVLWTVMGASAC